MWFKSKALSLLNPPVMIIQQLKPGQHTENLQAVDSPRLDLELDKRVQRNCLPQPPKYRYWPNLQMWNTHTNVLSDIMMTSVVIIEANQVILHCILFKRMLLRVWLEFY